MKFIVYYLFLFLFIVSCGQADETLTTRVERNDFTESIRVDGELQPIKTVNVVCPRFRGDGQIIWLVPEGSLVKQGDTVCILENTYLENEYFEDYQRVENAKAEFQKMQAELNLQVLLLESNLSNINASTAITQLDSIQLEFSTPLQKELVHLQIKRSQIERRKIQDQLKFLRQINASEMQKQKLQIEQAEIRYRESKAELDQLTLTAPIGGMIIYAEGRNGGAKVKEGDMVWERRPIVTIPDLSEFKMELTVNENNYKLIESGQSFRAHIDANPEVQFEGRISKKYPVGIPVTSGSTVKEYRIDATIDEVKNEFKPGLSATCDVEVAFVKDTLLIPSISIYNDDSVNYVYLKKDRLYEKKPVKISFSNLQTAIVNEGLKINDIIALSKPSDKLIINLN